MALGLKKARLELEKYTEGLELGIVERTRELVAANEELQRQIGERIKSEGSLKKAYEELKQAQMQLVQSEKMSSIGLLSASIVHDINNPNSFVGTNLVAMNDYFKNLSEILKFYAKIEEYISASPALATDAQGILKELTDLKKKLEIDYILQDLPKVIAESKDGVGRISKIVQNLKNFSHMGSETMTAANINSCIDLTLNIVWHELKYKAEVIKEYGDIPDIACFPQQISQVFMNLLINAAHAIETKGKISIKTYSRGNFVFAQISDTGCGMTEEVKQRIFEPFFTTKPVGQGTGLGLSIIHDIIQKHKGNISVESQPGKGTTFTIALPLKG